MVVERVVREAARSAHPNQTGATKETKLMRHRGLGHADERREIADAPLAMRQCVNQADTGRITQQLEDLGHRLDRSRGQKPGLHALENGDVRPMGRRARQIDVGVWLRGGIRRGHVI
jgi:hypothetical protein